MGFFDNFFNPPAANMQAPQAWQPQGQGQAAAGALGGIGNMGQYNQYASLMPQFNQVGQDTMNNPYGGGMLGGAQQAGQMGMQGAQNMFGQGGNLYGGANAIMQTGFDPQHQLYDRTATQTQQQQRAGQAARGVLSSPYGAGLENDAMKNFNIDWQNQQLQRQALAGNTASGMSGMGAQLQGAAPGMYAQSAAMPYNAYNQMGQNQMNIMGQMGQFGQNAANQQNQQNQGYLGYLGAMNQAGQVQNQGFQNQLQQNQQAWGQNKDIWNGLGQLAGGMGGFMLGGPMGAGMGAQLGGWAAGGLTGGQGFGTGQRGQNWW